MMIVTIKVTIIINMSTISENNNLSSVLFSKSRRAVLSLLYGHPDDSFYLRQIVRATGAGLGPIQRELKQLTAVGILCRTVKGNQVYYQANPNSPVFPELKNLISLFDSSSPSQSSGIPHISVPRDKITTFCKRHHIRKLSFFGSVLRDDFRQDSDIDVLVEFEPGHVPGFAIVDMEKELSEILGRKVDLRTPKDLSKYFRDNVVKEAKVQYESI